MFRTSTSFEHTHTDIYIYIYTSAPVASSGQNFGETRGRWVVHVVHVKPCTNQSEAGRSSIGPIEARPSQG